MFILIITTTIYAAGANPPIANSVNHTVVTGFVTEVACKAAAKDLIFRGGNITRAAACYATGAPQQQ